MPFNNGVAFFCHQGVANHNVFFGTDSDHSSYLMDMNLQLYENLTAVAGSQGVQVLVFPEFGLEPVHEAARADLYAYAETVPSASELVTPCNEDAEYAERPVLYRMSCAAKKQSLLLLVNMVDLQPCDATTDESCPEDGHYQVNLCNLSEDISINSV